MPQSNIDERRRELSRRQGKSTGTKQNPVVAVSGDHAGQGKWYLDDRAFVSPAQKGSWSYLEIALKPSSETRPDLLQGFHNDLGEASKAKGMKCSAFSSKTKGVHQIYSADPQDNRTLKDRLDQRIRSMKTEKQGLKLLVILLPDTDIPRYAMIKSICEQTLGIQTVCYVCTGHGASYSPSSGKVTLDNLALKINLKMTTTTANQQLDSNQRPAMLKGTGTMLMGIDVTHAGARALTGAPSIAAVVGSTNAEYSQFPAALRQNTNDTASAPATGPAIEKVVNLREMARQSIARWAKANGNKLPTRLIVFRDGLSESQLKMCREEEITQIRSAIEDLKTKLKRPAANPRLLAVCAIKRHHVRFFRDDNCAPEAQGGLFPRWNDPKKPKTNPTPGTLVDNGVTLRTDDDNSGDFFLISHDVIGNGTARPTHYVILCNELPGNPTKPDKIDIANMTHHLCYLFGRSTTSVRLAPPAYYADLAAERARCYARNVYAPAVIEEYKPDNPQHKIDLKLHDDIRDTMFYI